MSDATPPKASPSLRVAVSGASGLVGTELTTQLQQDGRKVLRLVRGSGSSSPGEIAWDPDGGTIDAAALEGLDAVVHLAGESIAQGRWTAAKKERILRSREDGTRLISQAVAGLDRPPRVLLCASAVGYYGDRGETRLDEDSASGDGFLADVCRRWEAAADPARERGIRVVHARLGVVLSGRGGALAKMLPPFKFGLGGVIGSGRQYMSWIALEDAASAMQFLLTRDQVQGPVNLVAPTPVTNREFTKTLGQVLHRPTVLPMPAFAARLALGEMADELLLVSQRVEPVRLQQAGFRFRYAGVQPALVAAVRQS